VTRDQASKIQILSAKHKDLLLTVDKMFDRFATLQEVQDMIEQKYHEKISSGAISTYKKKHWKAQKDKVREQKIALKAIAELIGEDGLDAGVRALLWQALQTMTPTQLIGLKKVLNDDKKVDLMKQQFALYAEEHGHKIGEPGSLSGSEGGALTEEGVGDFDAAQRVVERVKAIFGIGMTETEPPGRKLLRPAPEMLSPEVPPVPGEE
jgi:hypothetical protein